MQLELVQQPARFDGGMAPIWGAVLVQQTSSLGAAWVLVVWCLGVAWVMRSLQGAAVKGFAPVADVPFWVSDKFAAHAPSSHEVLVVGWGGGARVCLKRFQEEAPNPSAIKG